MKVTFQKYILNFKQASGTSRGILRTKETYFLFITKNGKKGVGECGLFRGLSIDDRPDYDDKLKWLCENINLEIDFLLSELKEFPSIQFGLEQALLSLKNEQTFELFPSVFTKGKDSIPINGLIWMGSKEFMQQQIKDKLHEGYATIKLKIGAIDFDTELDLLKSIRKEFAKDEIELRVDANGAFNPNNALEKSKRLSDFDLHSIEQPIKQGQWQEMARLCETTPLPIALDEELIGVFDVTKKEELLLTIKPQFIILKPSLVGGFKGSLEWIDLANKMNVGWWITSALESNVGLNAITQFAHSLGVTMPQGLGTGGLFTNNFKCPLEIRKGQIHYNNSRNWDFNLK
ncbi:MAG: o-succinylbenzoate synthase [Flavobacteriaceae bacterium]